MPGLDTTPPKNKGARYFALRCAVAILIALLAPAFHALSQSDQPKSSPAASAQSQDNGTFVIRKDVDEVVLHATVVDQKQHIVTDLDKNAFSVFEDGKEQSIISFHHEDIPVAMGIVIDNSGSMRENARR